MLVTVHGHYMFRHCPTILRYFNTFELWLSKKTAISIKKNNKQQKKLLNFKFEVEIERCVTHTNKSALPASYAERKTNDLKNTLFLLSDDKEFSQLRQTGHSISPDFHQRSETEIPILRVM